MSQKQTNDYMADRSLLIISKEIHNMLENLNTWSVALKELLKIRRTLLNNPTADQELYDIIDVFSELYYANDSKPRSVKVKPADTSNDEDVDNFLQSVVKEERKSKNITSAPMTDMQQAALNVLNNAEEEAKQMDAMINARRNQMEEDMRNPPSKPVKFLVDETVEIDMEPNLESALNTAMSNINNDPSIHPVVAMQKEQPILPKPVVKFNTPEVPEFDKKYGPLFSMTATQRNRLFQDWFKQAVTNVDSQLTGPVSPNTRDRLIREETTRQQDRYLESF